MREIKVKKNLQIRFLFTLLLAFTFTTIFAQNEILFKGTIGKNLKITFYLKGLAEGTNADAITGSYRYDNQKNFILLNGYRNNNGNLSLVEQSTANFSGTFLGTLKSDGIIGTWISADQEKTYPFRLKPVVGKKIELDSFRQAIVDKGDELRAY